MAIATTRFSKFIDFILDHETEYKKGHWGDDNFVRVENDPDDPGGTTKYGIDKRSHPRIDIENLTKEDAINIYFEEWTEAEIQNNPYPLGEIYFNAVVNCGIGRAKKLMIESKRDADKFLKAQADFYKRLAAAKPSSQKYLRGWLNRVEDLRKYVDL